MRRGARFQGLVTQLQEACAALGVHAEVVVLEDILEQQVRTMAANMRVQEATILRTYAELIDVSGLAARIAEAERQRLQELTDTPHAILSLADAGRVVASLGQAVRLVSLNHAALNRGDDKRWDAVGVLDDSSNALTLLGAALGETQSMGTMSVIVSDETIVHARRALTGAITNLRERRWTFGSDPEDIDVRVTSRMSNDLELLPPR